MRGLVCASAHVAAATGIVDALSMLKGASAWQVERLYSLDALRTDAAADLLVIYADRFPCDELCEVIGRVRITSPVCAVLVIAQDLPEHELANLFAAGMSDWLATSASHTELVLRAHRALGLIKATRPAEVRSLVHPKIGGIVGESALFLRELAKLPVMAGCDAGVLILGETGTGKEIFAQAVHYLSARASRPWVAINCGAIPAELVENELFGHVRGAYTTAHASQSGLVHEAEGGTLFLDEIDSLPYEAQAKLLRFVQTKEYRPVGSATTQRADVRIVAASNKALESLVTSGKFRRDLFYRLNVLTLTLPPLRERRDDIPALARHFIRHFAAEHRRNVQGLGTRALAHLMERDWPGNVRELQHVIERAVLMAQDSLIALDDIEQRTQNSEQPESFRRIKARVIENFERSYLENLLHANQGNLTLAANAAQKNRRALFELIRKYKIDLERFRSAGHSQSSAE